MDDNYPERKLEGRTLLAYNWIEDNTGRLRDVGCSYGYGTKFFTDKAKEVSGIDPNDEDIAIAKKRYKNINFQKSYLENVPFKTSSFDCVVMLDVLEHVIDEVQSLNEIYRILRGGGYLTISVPHQGLFSVFDTSNYSYLLFKNFPSFFKMLYRLKNNKNFQSQPPGKENRHRHYSLKDIKNLLDRSKFRNKHTINKKLRSGFLLMPLAANIRLASKIIFPKSIYKFIVAPFSALSKLEYKIPFGFLAYNIAVRVKKNA